MKYYRTKNFELIELEIYKETPSSIYFKQPHRHIGCEVEFCWHNQWQKRNTKDSLMTANKADAIRWLEHRRDTRIQNYNRVSKLEISPERIHKIQVSREEVISIESFEIDMDAKSELTIKTKSTRILNSFNKSRTIAVYLSPQKYKGRHASFNNQLVFGTWLVRTELEQIEVAEWLNNRRDWLVNQSWC